jgi:hypothetical protein
LWRWLSRAVAQGVVRHEGTGHPHDPFRYWLPAREEMMRPDGGTFEEMQAWNDRCAAALFDRLAKAAGATPREEAPLSPAEDATAAAPVATPEAMTMPVELVPPAPGPETAASPASAFDPRPAPAAEAVAAEALVCLPYPFNLMNPAEVPEEVWQRARAAQRNT